MANKPPHGPNEDPDVTLDEQRVYAQFPKGDDPPAHSHGPKQGFNTLVQINDGRWFTAAAKKDPGIQAFLEAPFSVTFAQFKSSHREAEVFIHKPHLVMAGRARGIHGSVARFPRNAEQQRIVTLVVNHERTLAKHVMRALIIEDGKIAGQMIHKEEWRETPQGEKRKKEKPAPKKRRR